jgi:hypothetical protein
MVSVGQHLCQTVFAHTASREGRRRAQRLGRKCAFFVVEYFYREVFA